MFNGICGNNVLLHY